MTVPITQSTKIGVTNGGALGATTTTASFSWAAGELLIFSVASALSGGAPVPTSITGGTSGLTFTLIDSQGAGNVGMSVWRCMPASSGSGTIVITWNGATRGLYELEGFVGALGGGTNGSAAIIQTIKTSAGSQTSMTMTFAGTPLTTSLILAACNHNDSAGTMTAGTNFTGVADATDGSAPVEHIYVEENPNGSAPTTVGLTSSVAGNFGFVAIEIGASTGPTGAGAIASAEAFGVPVLSGDNISPGSIASAEAFGVPLIAAAGGVWPDFIVEAAFANKALDLDANVVWTDITAYLRSFRLSRARSRELAKFDAGTLDMVLDNRDGRFSPENSGSPYSPYIRPNKRVRVRAQHGPLIRSLINVYANSWSEQFIKPKDAIVNFSGTDAFKLLAQYGLPDAWALVVQALGPKVWWRLNERSGTVFYDSASWTGTPTGPFPATISGTTVTLDQAPVVPGADANVSRAAAFTGTGEGKVVSPGVLPTTTTVSSIVYRSSSKAYNLNAPTSLTVTKPAGVALNDVMLAGVEIRGDKTISAVPSGWSLVRTGTSGGSQNDALLAVYSKVAGASEPANYKWTFGGGGGGDAAIVIAAFSGADPAAPIDTSPAATTSGGSSTVTAPTLSTAAVNEMLVCFFGSNPAYTGSNACSTSTASGMTEAADTQSQNNSGTGANRATVAVDYEPRPASGSIGGTRTATLSHGSDANVGISVAIKAASGAGSVATPFTVAFWLLQSAAQGNNDAYWRQGPISGTGLAANSAGVYQDILTTGSQKLRFSLGANNLDWSVGALPIPVPVPPASAVPILVVARYDGALLMALDTHGAGATTSRTLTLGAPVSILANDFEFGLADCTLDEIEVWPSYLTDAQVATLLAIATGTSVTTAVVDGALTQVGWASDLRQIQPDLVSGQVVSNLATSSSAGDKVLDYLQGTPVDTERGVLYMTGDGKVAFETLAFLQADSSRITPAIVFGSNTGAGEIGYTDLTPDYSDQIIVNDVEVTNTTTEAGTRNAFTEKYSKTDPVSIDEFSTYTLSLNTNYDDVLANRQTAVQARMSFELTRYSQPQRRILSLSIEGTPVASDWDVLIALTMLNRVTVNHVAPGAPDPITGLPTTRTIAKDYTIRQFDWEYQASPKSVKLTIGLDEGAIASP